MDVQKRPVLNNLKEVYREFKEKFPNQKIGFSKFAELRPFWLELVAYTQYACAQYTKM